MAIPTEEAQAAISAVRTVMTNNGAGDHSTEALRMIRSAVESEPDTAQSVTVESQTAHVVELKITIEVGVKVGAKDGRWGVIVGDAS